MFRIETEIQWFQRHYGFLKTFEEDFLIPFNLFERYLLDDFFIWLTSFWTCPRSVMVIAMDCGILVSEFLFQSRYYVHFRTNTLGKGMRPLNLHAMG